MSSLLRKHQQPLMIFVTVMIIIAFVLYWNGPTGSRNRLPHESDDIAKVYGETVTRTLLQREAQKAILASQLHLDLLSGLAGQRSTTQNEQINNFVWNSLVLRHEADLLQIEPTGDAVHSDDEVAAAIKNVPRFQTADGQFNPVAYADFVANYLPSLGFSAGDLEDVVAEDLRMKKIKTLLATTIVIPPDEFRAQYLLTHQKTDASVIHFNEADFTAGIKVSDDDVKSAFEHHLEGYKSEEKRGIKYVTFSLSDNEKKLTGKAHIDALQKLSDTVQKFVQALQEKGAKFDDAAAEFKAPVITAPPFGPSSPDPKLTAVPDLMQTVFLKLNEQSPLSDPLPDEAGSSYYVVYLEQVVPSKLLTLDEVRPQIVDQIKSSRAQEEITVKARDVRNKIQADMTAGKSFADAAKAEGQKVEAYPPFSYTEPDMEQADARQVLIASLDMKEGQLSNFVPTETGGDLIYIDKREPVDPKKFDADRALLEPAYDKEQVDFVFSEWLRKQRTAANISTDLTGSAKPTPVPAPQQ